MASIRKLHRRTLAAAAVAFAACAAPAVGWAGVGLVTTADLYGPWVATLSGVTGCGPTAMHVAISMNNLGTGTATVNTPNSPVPLVLGMVIVKNGNEVDTVLDSNAIISVFNKVDQ